MSEDKDKRKTGGRIPIEIPENLVQPDIEEPEVALPHFINHVSSLLRQLGIPRS